MLWCNRNSIKLTKLFYSSELAHNHIPLSAIALKVPKREIFDRSDFPNFYTIKSSWVGDLLVKILTILTYYFNFWGSYAAFSFWPAYWASEHTHKELMRMLRVRISSWCVCSACFKGTALCTCISTWCVCSVHAPVPDSYAQCTHQFLTRTLSVRVSSWCVCSAYA
jgi:hypothetical protein